MKIHNVIQGSVEWHEYRRGKFTASNFDKLFMKKTTQGYNDLINTIVYERISGEIPESYENEWMRRGKELESEARESYERDTFSKVKQIGFVEFDDWIGCSPDGLVGEEGLLEIKCPKYNTFINYILFGKAKDEYIYQIQGELFVTNRKWSDLFIYHPKLNPLAIRIERDEKIIQEIQKELIVAIEIVKERIKYIKGEK